MSASQLDALIESLRAAGINSFVGYFQDDAGSRTFLVPIDEIASFLADPLKYKAAACRVSRKRFAAWQRFADEGWQCRGTTVQGRRCRFSLPCKPEEFAEGISDYCDIHRGYK